ncbi:hypothetical protein E4634_17055 [Mangrovimicrobium sediminis]|uniref:Uncharacterized protein n=1 Tax=Mangrovimicrobium sediminis TaxID=2562682 RepID=A0A4Z0LWN9_9GAMM|nr:hypothetical protein [Haliea sp. SAOS-164]TGD71823.1 hypothetical protein E4634_17055 [Haliea sp. SAOS-164]
MDLGKHNLRKRMNPQHPLGCCGPAGSPAARFKTLARFVEPERFSSALEQTVHKKSRREVGFLYEWPAREDSNL